MAIRPFLAKGLTDPATRLSGSAICASFIPPTAFAPKRERVNILLIVVTHPRLIITFLFHNIFTVI